MVCTVHFARISQTRVHPQKEINAFLKYKVALKVWSVRFRVSPNPGSIYVLALVEVWKVAFCVKELQTCVEDIGERAKSSKADLKYTRVGSSC